MTMTLSELLKLFPKGSEQQINVIYPDNHCMYVPNPGFMLAGKNRDPVLDMRVAIRTCFWSWSIPARMTTSIR